VTTNIVVGIVVAIVIGFFLARGRGTVSGADARRIVDEGARLLDVRTPQEFASGHLPGAINIPVQELDRRMGELAGKERPIVLYCRSGMRSGRAARMLEKAGYAAVHDLGSISRW
jgi:phage shock protein E